MVHIPAQWVFATVTHPMTIFLNLLFVLRIHNIQFSEAHFSASISKILVSFLALSWAIIMLISLVYHYVWRNFVKVRNIAVRIIPLTPTRDPIIPVLHKFSYLGLLRCLAPVSKACLITHSYTPMKNLYSSFPKNSIKCQCSSPDI